MIDNVKCTCGEVNAHLDFYMYTQGSIQFYPNKENQFYHQKL